MNYFNDAKRTTEFELRTDRRIERNNVRSRMGEMQQAEADSVEQRRQRLAQQIQAEQEAVKEDLRQTYETPEQRVQAMRERVSELRYAREKERRALAAEQLDRAWRENADGIRHLESRKMTALVMDERSRQLDEKARRREFDAALDEQYAREWEATRQQKIEREIQDAQKREALKRDMLGTLEQQIGEKQRSRALVAESKADVHALLQEEWDASETAKARRAEEHRAQTQARRAELDYFNQLTLARKEAEAERERENDARLIAALVDKERGVEEREAALRQARHAETLMYREHLAQQMEREAVSDAANERLRLEQQEVEWAKRQAQWDAETRARERLMADVYASRREQLRAKAQRRNLSAAEAQAEAAALEQDIELARAEERESRARQLAKERENKNNLMQQARAVERRRAAEKQREADEHAAIREAYDAYEEKLSRELKRDIAIADHKHRTSNFQYTR